MKTWAKRFGEQLVDFGLPAVIVLAFERAPEWITYIQLVLAFCVLRQVNTISKKLS